MCRLLPPTWRRGRRTQWTRYPTSSVGPLHHGLQEDLAAGADIALGRILDLVVTDAVLAGHEHHGGGRHAADIAGVVAGAAHDIHVRVARLFSGAAHAVDQLLGEWRRPGVPDLFEL